MNPAEQQGYGPIFRRTIAGTFRFSGRATRSEVLVFYFGVIAVQLAASLVLWPLPDRIAYYSDLALEWLLLAPFPALFVRRVHDHGRSGAWVAVPLFIAVRNAALSGLSASAGIDARISFDRYLFVLDGLAVLAAIATFALLAAPGTAGPNTHGPDPRNRA